MAIFRSDDYHPFAFLTGDPRKPSKREDFHEKWWEKKKDSSRSASSRYARINNPRYNRMLQSSQTSRTIEPSLEARSVTLKEKKKKKKSDALLRERINEDSDEEAYLPCRLEEREREKELNSESGLHSWRDAWQPNDSEVVAQLNLRRSNHYDSSCCFVERTVPRNLI